MMNLTFINVMIDMYKLFTSTILLYEEFWMMALGESEKYGWSVTLVLTHQYGKNKRLLPALQLHRAKILAESILFQPCNSFNENTGSKLYTTLQLA